MNDPNIDTMARTMWGEARSEGRPGMAAVGWAIHNRAKIARDYVERRAKPHIIYGDGTEAGACKVPFQFACWNANDVNRPKLLAVTDADPQFRECLELAAQIIAETAPNPIGTMAHYVAERVTVKVGSQIFYPGS